MKANKLKIICDYECDTIAKAKKKYGIDIVPCQTLAEVGTLKPYYLWVDSETIVELYAYRRGYKQICYTLYHAQMAERKMADAVNELVYIGKHDDGFRMQRKWKCVLYRLQCDLQMIRECIKSDKRKQAKIKREDAKAEGDAE